MSDEAAITEPEPIVEETPAPETESTMTEFQERITGGIQLAQRHGVGYGRYTPAGAEVDVQTGEVTPPPKEPVKKPDEPAEPQPAPPARVPDEKSPLGRLKNYIARLEREHGQVAA